MVDLLALRFDLGTPWLNLLGTLGHAYSDAPIERLDGGERLAAFLEHEGLLPGGEITDADASLARELREALRPLILGTVRGDAVSESAVVALNAFLSSDEPARVSAGESGFVLEPPVSVRAALAWIARDAVTRLSGADAGHLRLCADELCSGAYFDPTGRRRWCADERCGVRARVRAHRARRKGEEAG